MKHNSLNNVYILKLKSPEFPTINSATNRQAAAMTSLGRKNGNSGGDSGIAPEEVEEKRSSPAMQKARAKWRPKSAAARSSRSSTARSRTTLLQAAENNVPYARSTKRSHSESSSSLAGASTSSGSWSGARRVL